MKRNHDLRPEQIQEINRKLVESAVSRASMVAFFFMVSFSLYGFTSFEFLHEFDPELKLWNNVWPRLLLNGLPFLAMYWTFKKNKSNAELKLWAWAFGFPVIFLMTCLIQVWPLIWAGNPGLYLHVHAANFFVLIMAMVLVAPPPQYLNTLVGLTLSLFVIPLSMIFIHLKDYSLLKFFLQDAGYGYFLAYLSARLNYKLRSELVIEQEVNQRKIESFLGKIVSQSIFENNEALLHPRRTQAFLMAIDVRGFTQLMKSSHSSQAGRFKERYHRLVAGAVGEIGGFIHKTHGDGHLISVGLMTPEVDLSDIPGIEHELEVAEARRKTLQLEKSIAIFNQIFERFEILKRELELDPELSVCAAIDFGEIGLNVLGDPNVRLEFDIDGLTVVRCARLEAFTKTLREALESRNSFLVLSSSASAFLPEKYQFNVFSTLKHAIKDFPDEATISYKEYKSRFFKSRAA